MEQRKNFDFQWLRILFIIHLASVVLTLLALLGTALDVSLGGGWVKWVQRAITLGTVICLFMLPGKFLPSAIARAALLLCNTFPMVLPRLLGLEAYMTVLNVLQWVTPVLTVLAMFLEYHAHSMTVPENANRWRILMLLSLSVTLVTNLLVLTLQDVFQKMVENGVTWGIRAYNTGAYLVTLIFGVWYLILLRNNLQMLGNKE